MKFRVTRNEPLEKAMNKANLVLVEVPVNTKKGQHRSHRWKRAIDALNQLFEDLGKKANAKDITFVDKDTNKKVNKEELIDDYKKRGKKENKTIQAFVAENYKVSTKESGKEEELTVNNKNTDNNKANATEDIKEAEAPKEKTITMASKSRYKQEKFYGTFKCGHEGEVYTGGYSDEYRQQAADDKFSHELCPHCYQKKIEEDREKAKKEAERLNLPELTGSVKQINWAVSIRNEYINEMKPFIEYAKNKDNDFNRLFIKVANDIQNITDSSYWIDNRKQNFPEMIKNNITMFKFDIPLVRKFTGEWTKNKISVLDPDTDLTPLSDEKATERREKLCEGINKTATNYLESLMEDIHPRYKNQESKTSYFLDELNAAVDIVKNNNDVMLWRNFRIGTFGIQDYYKYSPKMQYNEDDLSNPETLKKLDEAYSTRINLIKEFRKSKRKELLDEKQIESLDYLFKYTTYPPIYSEHFKDKNIEEVANEIISATKEEKQKLTDKQRIDKLAANGGLKRLGTKKIESKGEYKKTSNFEELRTNLEKLKGLHTDTLARAAMDMAGIDVPLYVRRNDRNIKLSPTSPCAGYCQYDYDGTIKEIAVADFTSDRAHSYKTTIHEVMHGLLAQTIASQGGSLAPKMKKNFNEGIVEMVGIASMKKAYGKEYRSRDRRTYVDYVVDTCLRLKRMDQFKGKTFSQIADTLGNAAFNRDGDTLSRVNDYLEQSYSASPDKCSLNEGYNDLEKMEKSAKKRFADEHNGDMTNFEKTQIAMLVDRLKNTDFTLEQALNSNQYGELAAILLYNMLEDEDDELLGLL